VTLPAAIKIKDLIQQTQVFNKNIISLMLLNNV